MEMSWWALAPTIALALVLAVAVLLRSGERARVSFLGRGSEPSATAAAIPSAYNALGATGKWLRNSRKPVWPIDYSDLSAHIRRGLTLAGMMVIVALMLVGDAWGSSGFALVMILMTALPFSAIGGITSVTHSFVLQMLPWRGPIVSTALGTALGFAAASILRNSELPKPALVWFAAIYGFIIGLIDFLSYSSMRAKVSEQQSA
jgi:hypothetical protein